MEIKINREIREYKENMFFGLSLRQLVFSVLACGVAVGIYFGLRNVLGTETVIWLCILGAAPFAAMGFVKYHGMTAEKLKSLGALGVQITGSGPTLFALFADTASRDRAAALMRG